MRCILCGDYLIPSPWGPRSVNGYVCRGDYPMYEENGLHVAVTWIEWQMMDEAQKVQA